jgi:predicted nucleic acid-binding protein
LTTLFLADISAYTVARRSPVAATRLRRLAADGTLATFVTVDLELGYSARDPREHQGIARVRDQLRQLPCVEQVASRARQVQALLAARSQHRAAGVMDLLAAAATEHDGASVLHYGTDFDHIAVVTGQQVDWIAPRGSVASRRLRDPLQRGTPYPEARLVRLLGASGWAATARRRCKTTGEGCPSSGPGSRLPGASVHHMLAPRGEVACATF